MSFQIFVNLTQRDVMDYLVVARERRPKIEMIIVVSDNMDMGENLLPNHFQKVYL